MTPEDKLVFSHLRVMDAVRNCGKDPNSRLFQLALISRCKEFDAAFDAYLTIRHQRSMSSYVKLHEDVRKPPLAMTGTG